MGSLNSVHERKPSLFAQLRENSDKRRVARILHDIECLGLELILDTSESVGGDRFGTVILDLKSKTESNALKLCERVVSATKKSDSFLAISEKLRKMSEEFGGNEIEIYLNTSAIHMSGKFWASVGMRVSRKAKAS